MPRFLCARSVTGEGRIQEEGMWWKTGDAVHGEWANATGPAVAAVAGIAAAMLVDDTARRPPADVAGRAGDGVGAVRRTPGTRDHLSQTDEADKKGVGP